MNLTPDNPRLVEMLIDEMEEDGVFEDEDEIDEFIAVEIYKKS